MIKEIYKTKDKTITLNIFKNSIESVRNNNIVKTACRVYEDGYIGISSTLGEPSEENWNEAIKNLDKKIVAGYQPKKEKRRERVTDNCNIDNNNLISTVEGFLERFSKEFPDFTLSQKISLINNEEILSNDTGLEYREVKRFLEIELLAKHKSSEDIYDISIAENVIGTYNEDEIFCRIKTMLDKFTNVVEKPEKSKLPIVIPDIYMGTVFKNIFNGEFVYKDASILSSKLGQEIFNANCSLFLDKGDVMLEKFFDEQGNTLENDKIDIVKNGVFTRALADEKVADEYNCQCTAAAGGTYDSVPKVESKWLRFKHTAENLRELLGDKEAIVLAITMGGDCTNEGDASLPALTSYLYKNGEFVGKLPRFNIKFNILEAFGKDYIGAVRERSISNLLDMVVFEGNIN